MSRIVYVNGSYVPEAEAKISVFDRAFLFGDGVYEVTAVLERRLLDFAPHLARLDRSLHEIALAPPLTHVELRVLHEELIARNGLDEGIVYLEITRGAADRDFAYPENVRPTVVAFTQSRPLIDNPYASTGVKVITIPDIRWKRRDIKSTAMLAQAMGKQEAKLEGAYEAWMVEDGRVTEGTSSSSFIVDAEGVVRTQPLGSHILPGVTRRAVLRLAQEEGVKRRGAAVQRGGGACRTRGVHERRVRLRAAGGRDRRRQDRRRKAGPNREIVPRALYRGGEKELMRLARIALFVAGRS